MSEKTTNHEHSPHQGERQNSRHGNQARERLIPAMGVLGALVVVGGLLVLVVILPPGVIRANRPDIRSASAADQLKAENDLRTTLVTMLGGVAVATGTVVAAFGLRETQRQNRKSSDLQRRGQVTERFSKAIDQLGARGENEAEKVDIRLGGIYALEQIARDTGNDEAGDLHWPIMEILTASIREHSKLSEDLGPGGRELDPQKAMSGLLFKVAADTQAALTVLGRRDWARDKGPLDLSSTNLQGAQLFDAKLQGALLIGANLRNASLSRANLEGVVLSMANLDLAFLDGANLAGANLAGANLEHAFLYGANLKGADLRAANLEGQSHLTQEELNQTICDENTRLPPGLTVEFKDWEKMSLLPPPPPRPRPWEFKPPRSEYKPPAPPPPPPGGAPPEQPPWPPGYEPPPPPPGHERPPSPGGSSPVPPPGGAPPLPPPMPPQV